MVARLQVLLVLWCSAVAPSLQMMRHVARAAAVAGPWTLSTTHLGITFTANGTVTAVTDTLSGKNYVAGQWPGAGHPPFVSVLHTGSPAAVAPTELSYDQGKGLITATFAGGTVVPISVEIADEMIVLKVLVEGAQLTKVSAVLFGVIGVNIASAAAEPVAAFDDAFALVLIPTSLHTYTDLTSSGGCNASAGATLRARSTAAAGITGGVAIWGGPQASLDAAIAAGEKKFGLPSPTIDGVWAKRAPDAHKGYFLISLTPAQLDDTIKYAKESGMKYITFLGIIEDGGSYNFSSDWGGMAGIKKAVAKINAAGLKAGMHTMSANIVKSSHYVTPVPDPRLAKATLNTLATAIDEKATFLQLTKAPEGFPVPYGAMAPQAGTDCLIGTEIITYKTVNASAPFGLTGVTRGAYGTKAAAHPAGANVSLLLQVYGGFLPDPATDMIQEIGANMANAYNEAGMDMVYFDGLEGMSGVGPPGIAESMLHQAFFDNLKREALVESSSGGGFLWHLNTRTGQTDWAATDRRAFLDYKKGPDMKAAHCNSLDIPDIGWWGYLTFAPGSYDATTPDQCEYMVARAVGWNASPNFETSTSALSGNGRTMECLARMKPWLSLGGRLSPAIKANLTAVGVDYALEISPQNESAYLIRPGKAHAAAIADPLVSPSLKWSVPRAFASSSHIGVRLRALSALPVGTNQTDLLLLYEDSGAVRDNQCPGAAATMNFSVVSDAPAGGPGSSALKLHMASPSTAVFGCARSIFAVKDISHSRVIEFTVYGDGSGATLEVELEDTSSTFRDYFVVLNFTGWRTIRRALPDARGLFTHAGGALPHDYNMAMRNYEWGATMGVNFYLTNTPAAGTTVYIGSVNALTEFPTWTSGNTTGTGAKLVIAGSELSVPSLRGGTPAGMVHPTPGTNNPDAHPPPIASMQCDYIECADVTNASSCRAFDANGFALNVSSVTSTQLSEAAHSDAGSIDVEYQPVKDWDARVEISVFEWAADSELLGPF